MKHKIGALASIVFAICLAQAEAAESRKVEFIAGTSKAGFSGDRGPATSAQLSNPYGLCRGPDKALYICDIDNHAIRRIGPDGVITTVAGTGKRGYSGDGGPATKAELNEPYEIRLAKNGEMYFVEMKNNIVRKVARGGIISTVAGTGKAGFSGDGGPAKEATFNQPHSIQFGPDGKLYICDIGNNRIRVVNLQTGIISTFSGTGEKKTSPDGSRISGAAFNGPRAMDFDSSGAMWLALREGNAIYKLDLKEDKIFRMAGTGAKGFSGNGGPALEATLSGPKGISIGPDGKVYFADTESHSIRMIDPKTRLLHLIAGTGHRGSNFDPDPLKCSFARPHGIFVDADGAIFVSDSENNRVVAIRAK